MVPLAWRSNVVEKWRKRVGVEPTGDGVTRRPPVLKTGMITGPHALPQEWPLISRFSGPFHALFRLRHDSQIRPRRLPPSGILLLRFLIRHRGQDDHFVALLPVHRRGNFVLGRELHRVDNANYFVEIPASAHGIAELEFNLLVGPEYEDGAHRRVVRRCA